MAVRNIRAGVCRTTRHASSTRTNSKLLLHHGNLFCDYGERICDCSGRYHSCSLNCEDESRRGQNQIPKPSFAHGILWRTWYVCPFVFNTGTELSYRISVGDTIQFAEYVERNIRLYQIRNLYPLRPSAAASWIRRSLAESIRSRKPYSVNLLLGGYDTATHEPHLYWVDYLGTMTEVPFGAHGYGSYFALSLLDRWVSRYSPMLCVCFICCIDNIHIDTTILKVPLKKVSRL